MFTRRDKPLQRLVDADPCWVDTKDRRGVWLLFDCPIHDGGCYLGVQVDPPLDGGPLLEPNRPHWKRDGEDFATLTLRPSIRILGPDCYWHGFIRAGRFVHCTDAH